MTQLGKITLALAALAALLLLSAGPGTRLGLWEFRFGFTLMRWAVYIGGASAVAALLCMLIPKVRRGNVAPLCLAMVLGVTASALPYLQMQKARSVPRIHDITTDFINPPSFEAVLPLRASAPNPAEYQGEEIAQQQREAYPDIQTIMLQADAASVFAAALASAKQQGWDIVAAEADRGLIEATDTTFWFGFKDDVVIRVTAEGRSARVDIRSKSRVGLSDVGANAERIRRFSKALKQRMR
jgi:uncharacterized protein (DUF1499 family)